MRNASVIAMDIGDGMRLYVSLLDNRGKIVHAGLSFETGNHVELAKMAALIEHWTTTGKL